MLSVSYHHQGASCPAINAFTYVYTYVCCSIFRFIFLKQHKYIFHEGGTGKEKGMQRRSRTTKLRVEYSSTVSSRTICVPLVVTSTVSLYVYMKKRKTKILKIKFEIETKRKLISIPVASGICMSPRNIYIWLETAPLGSFEESRSLQKINHHLNHTIIQDSPFSCHWQGGKAMGSVVQQLQASYLVRKKTGLG